MSQLSPKSRFRHLSGYLLIPHELLHVLGYQLVGRRCRYQWGQPYVTPLGTMSRRVHLVGLLFPFGIFALFFGLCAFLAGLSAGQVVQTGLSIWFVLWLGLTYLTGFYLSTTLGDLRKAYLLLTNKPWQAPTPLDRLFWPIVDWDDIRRQVDSPPVDDGPS